MTKNEARNSIKDFCLVRDFIPTNSYSDGTADCWEKRRERVKKRNKRK